MSHRIKVFKRSRGSLPSWCVYIPGDRFTYRVDSWVEARTLVGQYLATTNGRSWLLKRRLQLLSVALRATTFSTDGSDLHARQYSNGGVINA